MAKKKSHQQRLIESMKSLGTARTPITAAYESGKDRNILPKDIKSTREVRGQARRILVPEKIEPSPPPRRAEMTNPTSGTDRSGRLIPTPAYAFSARLRSFDPRSGAWNTRDANFVAEIRALDNNKRLYDANAAEYASYRTSVSRAEENTQDRTTAAQKKKLKAIASKRNGARKAISRAKGSRGGLSRAGGLRGGSR